MKDGMEASGRPISEGQAHYYGSLHQKHGAGVDAVASGNPIYKRMRYEKLCRVFLDDTDPGFDLHDVGFGLGHFQAYLQSKYPERGIRYSGSEVTPSFVDYAVDHLEGEFHLRDLSVCPYPDRHDYLVFGGTFYHLAGAGHEEFMAYVQRTLSHAFSMCRKGIAFNLVTEHVQYRLEDLFYAEIPRLISGIVGNHSRFFMLDHAYPLYEYTVCVFQPSYMERLYSEDAFSKYF